MKLIKIRGLFILVAFIAVVLLPSCAPVVNSPIITQNSENPADYISSFSDITDFASVTTALEYPDYNSVPDFSSVETISEAVSSIIENSNEIISVITQNPVSAISSGSSSQKQSSNQVSSVYSDKTSQNTNSIAPPPSSVGSVPGTSVTDGEIRAIWFSYLDWEAFFKGKNENEFKQETDKILNNISSIGINTLIIHAVPFGDSFYESSYFPWSSRISGKTGKSPGYDPFKIIVDKARQKNISVHAWINPMRTFTDSQMDSVPDTYQIKKWYKSTNRLDYMVKSEKGIWILNPASPEVRKLIADGAAEITSKYPVDAIHIDDYFYPDAWDKTQDKASYNKYKDNGGTLAIDDWRRANTEKMVKELYATVKSKNKNTMFGISPSGNFAYNYNTMYADVESWCKNPGGIMDYIAPQIYWEFNHPTAPYNKAINEWNSLCKNSPVKLYIGLAAYKIGNSSYGAEWAGRTDMIKAQIVAARGLSEYSGYCIFDYKSFFNPASSVAVAVSQEINNVKGLFV